jgi:hypothetical protein
MRATMRHGRTVLPLLALPLIAASGPVALKPGLWRIVNTPERATLDGRPLADLPFTQPVPEKVCLSSAHAADPAGWFTRDSAPTCTYRQRAIVGGRVAIVGTCPAEEAGQPAGSVRLTGTWTPTGYRLRFATVANGANGRMGFDGTLVGTRIGDCPS